MAQAMSDSGLPYIISFMIRDNGRLLDGTTIHDAIGTIDAGVDVRPECYMTNCVHPTVLYQALSQRFNSTALVRQRFLGHPGQRISPDPGGAGRRFKPCVLGCRSAGGCHDPSARQHEAEGVRRMLRDRRDAPRRDRAQADAASLNAVERAGW